MVTNIPFSKCNKTFIFENEQIVKRDNYGIFVVDIRKQLIYADGNVKYKSVFNPRHFDKYNLIFKTGMKNFIDKIITIDPDMSELYKAQIDSMYEKMFFEYKTDLHKIYDFCIECGIDYLNILDNSCRICAPGINKTQKSLEKIYEEEQLNANDKTRPEFGGK